MKWKIEDSNPLKEGDIIPTLETYDRQYYNLKINDIGKLTDIRIERNKRNYRKQKLHLRIYRSTLDVMNEENSIALQGKPQGSGINEKLVKEYVKNNPAHSPTEIARNLGVSRMTVYKYI